MNPDEIALRYMLWLHHNWCRLGMQYGDDGEMQCSECGVDFKRYTPTIIQTLKDAKVFRDRIAHQQKKDQPAC